jgi:hypothetical protein
MQMSFIGPLEIMEIRRANEAGAIQIEIWRIVSGKRGKFSATRVKKMTNGYVNGNGYSRENFGKKMCGIHEINSGGNHVRPNTIAGVGGGTIGSNVYENGTVVKKREKTGWRRKMDF